ncbi:MAG: hypothetical protein R3F20_03050 [Planctomycetota bacterium]
MRTMTMMAALLLLATGAVAQTIETKTDADRRALREMRNRLQRQVISVDWKDRELGDVLRELRATLGLNLVVARALRESAADAEISLTLDGVTAWDLLALLQESHDLGFRMGGRLLWVTTREDAVRRAMVTRVRDARMLGYRPPDFPGPRLGLDLGRPSDREEVTVEPREQIDAGEIEELLKSMTGEKEWEIEGASLSISGGLLIVRHTASMQAKVWRAAARLETL